MTAFPKLKQRSNCDVLMVGAGITGALITNAMPGAGLKVCVVDRRDLAWASTVC